MIASRTRALTLLGTAFVLGLIVGGAGIALAARAGVAGWIWRGHGQGRSNTTYGVRLEGALHLGLGTPARDSITAIWDGQRRDVDSIQHTIWAPTESLFQMIRPAIDARRAQARSEIRALLTAPQQVKYDSMNAAIDVQRKKMHDQGSRGGSPGMSGPGGPGPRGGFNRGPN